MCAANPQALIGVNPDGRICICNPAAAAALGIDADDLIGWQLAAHPKTSPLALSLSRALESGEMVAQSLDLPSGEPGQVHLFVAPESDQDGATQETGGRLPYQMREIVHELKLPISSAKSFIDLVEAAGALNDKQQKWARRAQLSLISMISLVHELLDMAWLESGAALTLHETDLNLLTERAASQYEDYARHRGVQLVLDLPPDGCPLTGDERRLEGAIINLISNAIKYSPDGGPVEVAIRCQDQAITLTVKDQGIGIAPDHVPHIFEPFYRVRIPATQRIEGSGLGLSIVKAIVEKHGGTVFVESVVGEGSTFGFRLPQTN